MNCSLVVVGMLRFETVAVQPVLPLMGGVFGFDSHYDPLLAIDRKVEMAVVIAGFNLAAEHFKDADDLSGLCRIVQMRALILRQAIADGWHSSVRGGVSNDRLQTGLLHPSFPLIDLVVCW